MYLEAVSKIAREAGEVILRYYRTGITVSIKADRSPVTEADREAHRLILERLRELAPEVPCVSEEGDIPPPDARRPWARFWLVDPLDGTKEFIKGRGEFTVNIALVQGTRPAVGVLYAPVPELLYFAAAGRGAWRQRSHGEPERIRVREPDEAKGYVSIESRSHRASVAEEWLARLPIRERRPVGSALKLCVIAEGEADLYIRSGTTWEWDTAAGHAILEEAGGSVVDFNGNSLRYGKPSLKNNRFIAFGGRGPVLARLLARLGLPAVRQPGKSSETP